MISHLCKGSISRLNGEGARMGFREFQRYFGLSAVPHVFVCPPYYLSTLPTMHCARDCINRLLCPLASSCIQPKVGGTGRRRRGRRAKSWCLFPSRVTSKFSALVRWPCPYSFLCLWVSVITLSHGFCRPRSKKRTYCYKPQVLHNSLWFTCT